MTLAIWVVPFIIAVSSTIYFNKKTTFAFVKEHIILYSVLDVLGTYALMMIFLSAIVERTYIFEFVFFILFLVITIIHLAFGKHFTQDDDLLLETFKNNIIVQCTTIMPYLVFMYLYRNLPSLAVVNVLSIGSALALFWVSMYMKKLTIKVAGAVQLKLDFLSKNRMLITYMIFSGFLMLIIGVFVFTSKTEMQKRLDYPLHLFSSYVDQDMIFDWDTVQILDFQKLPNSYGEEDVLLVIRDTDDMEYFVALQYFSRTNFPDFYYVELGQSKEFYPSNIGGPNNTAITSPSGLYRYYDSELHLVPGTESKPTTIIEYNDSTYYLVEDALQQYTLIDTEFTIADTIGGVEFVAINQQLFLKTATTYTTFTDNETPSLTYQIVENAVPFYDKTTSKMYQILQTATDSVVTITDTETEKTIHIPTKEPDRIMPIFNGTLYTPYQFAFRNKTYKLDYGLYSYAFKNEDDTYETFITYDSEYYCVSSIDDSSIKIIQQDNFDKTDLQIFQTTGYDFSINAPILLENTLFTVLRYSLFVIIGIFVPITNNSKYNTFDSIF